MNRELVFGEADSDVRWSPSERKILIAFEGISQVGKVPQLPRVLSNESDESKESKARIPWGGLM